MSRITIQIEEPRTCGGCPFYSFKPYSCPNERGMQADCSMGYMGGVDMRDMSFDHIKYEGCKLGKDTNPKTIEMEMKLSEGEVKKAIKEYLEARNYNIKNIRLEVKIEQHGRIHPVNMAVFKCAKVEVETDDRYNNC